MCLSLKIKLRITQPHVNTLYYVSDWSVWPIVLQWDCKIAITWLKVDHRHKINEFRGFKKYSGVYVFLSPVFKKREEKCLLLLENGSPEASTIHRERKRERGRDIERL